MKEKLLIVAVPLLLVVAGGLALKALIPKDRQEGLDLREPEAPPTGGLAFFKTKAKIETPLPGKLKASAPVPKAASGDSWPGFRGAARDGISRDATPLAESWPAAGPRTQWSIPVGSGYAGAAIAGGRVYLLDYDQEKQSDCLRCLKLSDASELWRRWYSVPIRQQHGYSRTVPAVAGGYVVTLGPMCHVLCVDANTGEARWSLDLVAEYGTTVPEWYAGQCPLIETINGRPTVILAPGGKALMVAKDCETGKIVWSTPNPRKMRMTHASIMPMVFGGRRTYVYPASGGAVGVDAKTGKLLWVYDKWRISPANVPTPIVVPGGRVFLSGGYGAGALMLQLEQQGDRIVPKVLFKVGPKVFGAEQQTPILVGERLYSVLPPDAGGAKGQLACLDLSGKQRWTSGGKYRFGLGPYLVVGGKLLLLDDDGLLTMAKVDPGGWKPLAQHKAIAGHECWGPLALAGGLLVARSKKKLVCLDLRRTTR